MSRSPSYTREKEPLLGSKEKKESETSNSSSTQHDQKDDSEDDELENTSFLTRLARRFTKKKNNNKEQYRFIYIGRTTPENERLVKYPSNAVKTSKYNVFTFLPKNVFEQFRYIDSLSVVKSEEDELIFLSCRRIANFYFLIIAILTVSCYNLCMISLISQFPSFYSSSSFLLFSYILSCFLFLSSFPFSPFPTPAFILSLLPPSFRTLIPIFCTYGSSFHLSLL